MRQPTTIQRTKKEADINKFANGADKTPVDADRRPNAPKKYKTINVHLNLYEFEKLEAACEATGESKLGYIRKVLLESLD